MGASDGTPPELRKKLGNKELPLIVFEWLDGGNLFQMIHGGFFSSDLGDTFACMKNTKILCPNGMCTFVWSVSLEVYSCGFRGSCRASGWY